MDSVPRVSVGMFVRNGGRFLEEAIASILAQDFEDIELIISDNGSTDSTLQVCRRFAQADGRVRYYRSSSNRGAAWNANRVFELARGEYFRWATHDDFLAPSCIGRCVAALDSDPGAVLCYPKTMLVDEYGRELGGYEDNLDLCEEAPHQRLRRLLRELRLCNAVFGLIRSSALRSVRPMGNYNASDTVLLAELSLAGRFVELPDRLFYRRYHAGMSCRAHSSLDDRAAWFDPANRGKRRNAFYNLRLMTEHLRGIGASGIGRRARARCYWVVAAHWLRQPTAFLGDLRRAITPRSLHGS